MQSITELISAVRDAGDSEPNAMVSLTLRSDDAKWVQLLCDRINVSYPFDTAPAVTVGQLGLPHAEKAHPNFWESNLFADFDTTSMNSAELSAFLISYLTTAFGTADLSEYDLSFDVAERGTIKAGTARELLRAIAEIKCSLGGKSRRKDA